MADVNSSTTQGQGDNGQAVPATPTQVQGDNGQTTADVVPAAEYQALLKEKNSLAVQLRHARKNSGSSVKADGEGTQPAASNYDPDDVARLRQEVNDLKAKDARRIESVKSTALKSTAMELGFSGERQEAFIAIVKDRFGSRLEVQDDETVAYFDTAKDQKIPIAEVMKELAAKYEFLKSPIQTPAVKGFVSGTAAAPKSYAEMTTEESLKLDPETRRQLAYKAYLAGN